MHYIVNHYDLLCFLTTRGLLFFLSEVWSEVSSEKSFSRGMLFMGRCIAFGGPAVRRKMTNVINMNISPTLTLKYLRKV